MCYIITHKKGSQTWKKRSKINSNNVHKKKPSKENFSKNIKKKLYYRSFFITNDNTGSATVYPHIFVQLLSSKNENTQKIIIIRLMNKVFFLCSIYILFMVHYYTIYIHTRKTIQVHTFEMPIEPLYREIRTTWIVNRILSSK